MEDWNDLWEVGWDDVPKQEANATLLPTGIVPAAVTAPVATAAAPGCASAATAAVGLALPPSHGGYRGPTLVHIDIKDVVAALPAAGTLLTRDNISWKERRGLTSAVHKIQRYAHIPEQRIEEFIGGEEERLGVTYSRKSHGACGIYSSRRTIQCSRGPANNAKSAAEVYQATMATRAAAAAAGTQARTGTKAMTNRSLKIGCKCSFHIKVLAAQPDIAEVVLEPFAHSAECGVMRGGLSKGIQAGRTLVHCEAITPCHPQLSPLGRSASKMLKLSATGYVCESLLTDVKATLEREPSVSSGMLVHRVQRDILHDLMMKHKCTSKQQMQGRGLHSSTF